MCANGVEGSVKVDRRLKIILESTLEKHLSRVLFLGVTIGLNRDLSSTHIYATDIR